MLKKIFGLFVTLTIIFSSTSSVLAESLLTEDEKYRIEVLKWEIENIKQKKRDWDKNFKGDTNTSEWMKKYLEEAFVFEKQMSDKWEEILTIEWKAYKAIPGTDISISKKTIQSFQNRGISHNLSDENSTMAIAVPIIKKIGNDYMIKWNLLKVGDIVLLQPKIWHRHWWANFSTYQHAAIYVGGGRFLQAYWPWVNSWYMTVSDTIDLSKIEKIMILRMNLNWQEIRNFRNYESNLTGKPYPEVTQEMWVSKRSMNSFYCTSLIWRMYLSWTRYVDLDSDTSGNVDFVFPNDLVNSNEIRERIFIEL